MNIERAKQEIRRTLRAYRKTLPNGSLKIPVEKQRPLLLIGPPGIGKTAIMKQLAEETGEGLVAYSMTHHTRQSAIGLPIIETRSYGGAQRTITEYTMSEIVASLYDYIEKTGKQTGILFLDEINCVSETLSPVMLQLLQNKTFGTHALPAGWIIVAAGNPPEYNSAVREFDMATLDRVKNMDIEPDLAVWQRYAAEQHLHPAIRTFLTVYPERFYVIREVNRERYFVTARGWEDLSLMLEACEEEGDPVDEELVAEYLRDPETAHDFFCFYDLFHAYAVNWLADNLPDFRGSLRLRPDVLRALPEVGCLTLSGLLFRQLEAEAHEIHTGLVLRQRRLLENELRAALPRFVKDTERTAFFARKRGELDRRVKTSQLSAESAEEERQALLVLEQDWCELLRENPTDAADRFPAVEAAALASREAACRAAEETFREYTEEAFAILRACPCGETALRYLQADLAGLEQNGVRKP